MTEKDPLESLVKSSEWKEGYTVGYRAGEDDMCTEMGSDYSDGEKAGIIKGTEGSKKCLLNIQRIANQWNIREIDANTAMDRLFKYLRRNKSIINP